jgi:hypothetical protein
LITVFLFVVHVCILSWVFCWGLFVCLERVFFVFILFFFCSVLINSLKTSSKSITLVSSGRSSKGQATNQSTIIHQMSI